jgi:hypothetical protein
MRVTENVLYLDDHRKLNKNRFRTVVELPPAEVQQTVLIFEAVLNFERFSHDQLNQNRFQNRLPEPPKTVYSDCP